MLGEVEAPAQPEIQRVIIESASGVPRDSGGAVVDVGIEITIGARLNIEGQRRRVGEDVADLKSFERVSNSGIPAPAPVRSTAASHPPWSCDSPSSDAGAAAPSFAPPARAISRSE